jgi:hypothetical protein
MSYTTDDYDLEKQASSERQTASAGSSNDPQHGVSNTTVVDTSHAVSGAHLATGSSLTARLLRAAGKLGVEQRGIERVPEDERTETGFKALLNISTMWFSANMVVAAFALGLLAQSVFNLGVADAMLVILFFNLIGITPVCFFSTFGPRFGLWVCTFFLFVVECPFSCWKLGSGKSAKRVNGLFDANIFSSIQTTDGALALLVWMVRREA